MLSVTERAVYGASMSLVPRLWQNSPDSLARSRWSGLKAALPRTDKLWMHWPSRASGYYHQSALSSNIASGGARGRATVARMRN